MSDQTQAAFALVVGEAVLDVVRAAGRPAISRPGGSAVNAAVALARLGRRVGLATCFAEDEGGRTIAAHLASAQVALSGDPHVVAATAQADAVIDASGAAEYRISVDWRLPALGGLGVSGAAAPRVVHVTSFAPLLAPGADDVVALVRRVGASCAVSYDVNLRPAVTGTGPEVVAAVLRMAGLADLVKASDEDLAALWPDADAQTAVQRLLDAGASAVVVTCGADGATWHVGAGGAHAGGVPGFVVKVVDTIGAGDTFSAALLHRLWPQLGAGTGARLAGLDASTWDDALAFAARAAAVTVSRPGADPPLAREV